MFTYFFVCYFLIINKIDTIEVFLFIGLGRNFVLTRSMLHFFLNSVNTCKFLLLIKYERKCVFILF